MAVSRSSPPNHNRGEGHNEQIASLNSRTEHHRRTQKQFIGTNRTDVSRVAFSPIMMQGSHSSNSKGSEQTTGIAATGDVNFDRPTTMSSSRALPVHDDQLRVATSPRHPTHSNTTPTTSSASEEIILTSSRIRLLSHFTYAIAPWVSQYTFFSSSRPLEPMPVCLFFIQLDIYDPGETLGLRIPRLAMTSPLVLEAVLDLSAVSAGTYVEGSGRLSNSLRFRDMFREPAQISDFAALQLLVVSVLMKTRPFVESVSDTWEPIFTAGGTRPDFTRNFEDVNHHRIWFGLVVLMSRLGMIPVIFLI